MFCRLKFRFTISEQTDQDYGNKLPNGSYNGMIGKLQRLESNWSITDFNETPERSEVIAFSVPIIDNPKMIVTRLKFSNLFCITLAVTVDH